MNLALTISTLRSIPIAGTLLLLALGHSSVCEGQVRIATYNDSGNVAGSGNGLQTVLGAIGDESRSGIQRPLDILSLQEQDTSLASTTRVLSILNSIYGSGAYAASTVKGNGDSTQSVIFNTKTVQLVSQAAILSTSTSGAPRQPLRFQFRPVGYTAAADFYVYSNHYKADQDSTSAARRGVEATGTRANADALGASARVIYTGDFNTYTSSEAAIQNLTAAGGNGRAVDPINRLGNWHNSSSYADVFTQSPVITNGANYTDQVGGGLDDRFDFQLSNAAVNSGHGFSYISGTYHAFGNANGLQFNSDITTSGAAAALQPYFPAYTTAQIQAVLQALAQTSDHIPVIADYRLPAIQNVNATAAAPPRVIVNASVAVAATIANSAPVASVNAADELDYTASLTNSSTTAQSGVVRATEAAQIKSFLLNAATPGPMSATLNVTSSSPSVANGVSNTAYAYTVLAHSTPSLDAASVVTSQSIDFNIVAVGKTRTDQVAATNIADPSGYTARLNLSSASLTGSDEVMSTFASVSNLDAGTSVNVPLSFTPVRFGSADATLSIATSDENIPGATARDKLAISIHGFGAYAGDANLSNTVDFADLLALAQHFGEQTGATWFDGDFDGNHTVDFNDLLALAQNFGFTGSTGITVGADQFASDWALAQALVPEPTSLLAGASIAMVLRRRCRRGI